MNNFKDFEIELPPLPFTGDKIKISKILNQEIIVHRYRLEKSQYSDQRLDMQITIKNETRLTWTSAKGLIDSIQKVPADGFPFKNIIIQDNDRYQFS
jgi:hypothetical protein